MKRTIRTFLFAVTLVLFTATSLAAAPRDDAPDTSADYVLTAAYPNPFNLSTSFKLTVKSEQTVKVNVYNTLGKQVRSLYNDRMEANETRSFTFKAEGIPTGIYLYQVEGETFKIARQVTFLK